MKSLFIFLCFASCVSGFAQTSGLKGNSFKERFRFGFEAGAYYDPSMSGNSYLVRPNQVLRMTAYIALAPKHLLGLQLGGQSCNLRTKDIEKAFYEGAEHIELKEMTSGYDNINQLGIVYRYLHVFNSGVTLAPSFRTGALFVAKALIRAKTVFL